MRFIRTHRRASGPSERWPRRHRRRALAGPRRGRVTAIAGLSIAVLGLAYAGFGGTSARPRPPLRLDAATPTATTAQAATTAHAGTAAQAAPTAAGTTSAAGTRSAAGTAAASGRHVCSQATRPGLMTCMMLLRTDLREHPRLAHDAAPAGYGYGPSDLQSAYGLPSASAGSGQTIAIVDAYDDPNAESDLASYRSAYGLPACTAANGCFRKVNQNGQASPLPGPSRTGPTATGWATEESLDLDMVSAICPNCHILVAEAGDPGIDSLGTAVDSAVAMGAAYVSNSYGGQESPSETGYDARYFDHPGVAVTFSAGDTGYGVSYPAASRGVIAVGGTTLTRDTSASRGWSETAWSGTGSGCSAEESKPGWQQDSGCGDRTGNDVAADADLNTGVAAYDSYDQAGWFEAGGTSTASPIVAASYALAGQPAAGSYPSAALYANHASLNDVISGSDGTCSPAYLCTAGAGYDGPTGWGTPNGTGAFTTAAQPVTGAITSGITGKCLDDHGDSSANGNKIDLYSCNGTAAQNWTAGTDRSIQVNGKCLDVIGQATANGSKVDLFGCNGGGNQKWKVMPNGQIVGQQSGKCLDDPGWSTANGTQLDIWSCVSQANESWYPPPPTAATGPANSGISDYSGTAGMCLDDNGDRSTNGNKIDIWDCNGTPAQNWTAEPDGTVQVNGKCLDVYQNGYANGSRTDLYTCVKGAMNQQWRLQANGNLVSLASGKCLDDPGLSTTNGTQLDIWSCVNQANESWTLP